MAELLRDVFSKAFEDTRHFFGWNRRTLVFSLLYIVGALTHFLLFGKEVAVNEIGVWVSYFLIPIGGFTVLLFIWNMIAAPYRLSKERATQYKSKFELAEARAQQLEKELTLLKTPLLKIEHDENDLSYYHQSTFSPATTEELFDNLDIGALSNIALNKVQQFRLCRIVIHNSSSVVVKNVEVKLTEITPLPHELRGILDLNLHYMHDDTPPYKQFEDINPGGRKFIDVIQWNWDMENEPFYSICTSNEHINAPFPVYETKVTHINGGGKYDYNFERGEEINYKIKIVVTAGNAESICKNFCFGLKRKNSDEDIKLYLWSAD